MSKPITEYVKPESNPELTETQEQFIKRALASGEKAKKTGKYVTYEEVMVKLNEILALAEATKIVKVR